MTNINRNGKVMASAAIRSLFLVGVFGLVLSACSTESSGQATPSDPGSAVETTETSASDSQSADDLLAPSVALPKDGSQVPICELFAADILESVGLDPEGRPDASGEYSGCGYSAAEDRTAVMGINLNDNSGGLSNLYQQRDRYPDFREFEIAGLPALQASDPGASGYCGIFVGLSDEQYLAFRSSAGLDDPEDVDLCQRAVDFAEAAVPTIPDA